MVFKGEKGFFYRGKDFRNWMSIAVKWGTGFLKGDFPSAGGFAHVLAIKKKKKSNRKITKAYLSLSHKKTPKIPYSGPRVLDHRPFQSWKKARKWRSRSKTLGRTETFPTLEWAKIQLWNGQKHDLKPLGHCTGFWAPFKTPLKYKIINFQTERPKAVRDCFQNWDDATSNSPDLNGEWKNNERFHT